MFNVNVEYTSIDGVPESQGSANGNLVVPVEKRWRDTRKLRRMNGLYAPLMPIMATALAWWTNSEWAWFLGPVLVFGLIPLLDWVEGLDTFNPPDSEYERLDADLYYRWVVAAFIPLQYFGLIWACVVWTTYDLSWVGSLGLALTVAMVAGIGINTAHELGHKHPAIERWLSKIALAQSCYGHFVIEHNRGHHARVSTPEDPASSRLGESFWEFLPRTVIGSFRSALHLERQREQRLGIRFWSLQNELLQAWLLSAVLFGGLIAFFGWTIAPWLALQAVVGFCLLEVVNYIEHYGLLRQKNENGRYERCRPEHSWNASQRASNLFLFQLQRHSDHHANPLRRYQNLRHFDDVPQLPTGYAGMTFLALVPPLWRKVMDPRVVQHYQGDVTLANIHPRAYDRIIRTYAGGMSELAA